LIGKGAALDAGNNLNLVQNARKEGFQLVEPIQSEFNKTYHGNITDGRNSIFSFNFSKANDKV
jgi:hypothetical protein